ncbi:MAG: copper chaperone PCu(A)C [Candidatus Competibacterales bacterium]
MLRSTLLAVSLVLSAQAMADDFTVGDIAIDHPHARETPGMAMVGAGYMTLVNRGAQPDRLIRAEAQVSETVELHTHTMEDGVMRMREVKAIEVPAHGETALEPGGLHVMFIDLKAPFVAGERFPVTLTFENAGEVQVEFAVEAPGQGGRGMDHGNGHGGHGGHGMDHDQDHEPK